MNQMINIPHLGGGWYSFQEIPQGERYVKVHALRCGTAQKALKQAKKIHQGYDYQIEPNIEDGTTQEAEG